MRRYIDADALKKAFLKPMNDFATRVSNSLEIGEIIDAQPSADVAPVVHGEWQDIGVWSEVNGAKINSCSNCHYHYVGFGDEFAYCPSCGARMDGGR